MANKRFLLPSLDFDSSGSAIFRFFGRIVRAGIHYVDAKLPMIRMVCPDEIDNKGICNLCTLHNMKPASRLISLGWDCDKNRWAVYLGTPATFDKISELCKEAGISSEDLEKGDGPDILMQKVGANTEIAILNETIGHPRGGGIASMPAVDSAFEYIRVNSVWSDFDNIGDVEQAFPKGNKESMFKGFSGIQGSSSWSGSYTSGIGLSGYVGMSGISGVSGTTGFTASKNIPEKDKPPVLAKPKIKPMDGNNRLPGIDRWDLS